MGDWAGTVPSILAGDVPTGDDWSAILAELAALSAAWTTYTPSWTAASVNPAIGNGTITGGYRRVGKTIEARIRVVAGSTTTFGTGQYYLSLPVSAAASSWQVGSCRLLDSGTANKSATAFVFSTNDKVALIQNITDVNATAPHTMATGDEIEVNIQYEAA